MFEIQILLILKEGNTMKRCLAILCGSFLFSVCLGFGFVKAVDYQTGTDLLLQETAGKLVDDISSGAISVNEVSLSDISLEDISVDDVDLVEKDYSIDDLTVGDKLKLLWLYLKMKTTEHKYIFSAAAVTIILAAASAYYFSKKNEKVPAPKN